MYELIILLNNKYKIQSFLKEIKEKLNDIQILSIYISEERKLEYKIKNNEYGIFVIIEFKKNNILLNKIKNNKQIIRYLIRKI